MRRSRRFVSDGFRSSPSSGFWTGGGLSFDNAIRIADFFGVSLDWLAGRSADPVLHAGDDRAARVILRSYEVMGPAGRRTLATVAKSMALDPSNWDAKPAARQRD